jgi:signal transduction histidine kinase/CheY-like chemotaxis protein
MKWGWRCLPLRSQWNLAGALLCSACVLGGLLVFSVQLEAGSKRWMSGLALAITRVLAQAVSPALERGDAAAGQRQLEVLAALPEAAFGVLLREDGTPLAVWHPELVPGEPWPDVTREVLFLPTAVVARLPVRTRGGSQGMLLVGLERAGLEREGARARWQAFLFSLLLWMLGVGGVFGVGALLMHPLERVTRVVQRLAEGDWRAREALEPSPPDEPGRLSVAVSRLVVGVHAQVELLDALVGEVRGYQERLYEQGKLLDAQSRELLQVRDQLIVAERRSSVGVLSASVAHEVNNPLAFITANIQFSLDELQDLARRDAFPAEYRVREEAWVEITHALAEARDGCTRVQHIVQSLKSFSRGDDGRLMSMDLVPALKTAINMARGEIRHRARLEQELQEDLRVDANEVRLSQVFLNLLLNAAHSIQPGDAEHNKIRVGLRRGADGWVRVSIADTGCGMSPEVRARLFTPFFTTKPVGMGTGLGLSVCQGLVQGMGGRIEVQSEPGQGSTFTVLLAESSVRRRAEGPGKPSPAEARRTRVLIVDDEPWVGISLRRALGREHEVCVASSAREALARVCQGASFDAILCDLMMPAMNGMEFFAELQRTSPEQAERVLFLTGGAFTDEGRAFLERHQERQLLKPLDLDTLRERLLVLMRPVSPPPPPENASDALPSSEPLVLNGPCV